MRGGDVTSRPVAERRQRDLLRVYSAARRAAVRVGVAAPQSLPASLLPSTARATVAAHARELELLAELRCNSNNNGGRRHVRPAQRRRMREGASARDYTYDR